MISLGASRCKGPMRMCLERDFADSAGRYVLELTVVFCVW